MYAEQILERTVVRLFDQNGSTLGSGCFITLDGKILTCDHVVRGVSRVFAETADGPELQVVREELEGLAGHDLAVLSVSGSDPGLAVAPAPIEPALGVTNFASRGFHFEDRGFRGPVPVRGEVRGETAVQYGRYSLPRALALVGDTYAKGLSGAPLVDPETGVAFGVVVSYQKGESITGAAVPLEAAVASCEPLRALMAENRETVPRFGCFLNARGLEAVCHRQVEMALEALVDRRLYDPALYYPRPSLAATLSDFRAHERLCLPLVGAAGVGKTTLLANEAHHWPGNALLLRGLDIGQTSADIGDLVAQALDALDAPLCLTETSHLFAAAGESPGGLTILLDGVNEAQVSLEHMAREWIPASLAKLERSGVKLVLTCRPEHWTRWERAFPMSLVFASAQESEEGIPRYGPRVDVTDLEGRELEVALETYGFDETFAWASHPLLMRLAREAALEGTGSHARSRVSVLGSFVARKCADVANAVEPVANAKMVEGDLKRFAQHLLETKSAELDHAAYDELFRARPGVGAELVREYVVQETSDGYRFTFDEIGEYLMSFALPSDAAASEPAGDVNAQGAARFVMLRLEGEGETTAVAERLAQWTDSLSGRNFMRASNQLTLFLDASANADSYFPQLKAFIRKARALDVDENRGVHQLRRLVSTASLSPLLRLKLLREYLPWVSYYPWRYKDRPMQAPYFQQRGREGGIVAAAVQQDPRGGLAEILAWLDDSTALHGNEGSIAEFAVASLFHLREKFLGALFSSLLQLDRDHGLLMDILSEDFAALRPQIEAISAPLGDKAAERVVDVGEVSRDASPALAKRLLAMVSGDETAAPGARTRAAALQLGLDPDDDEAWEVLAAVFLASGHGSSWFQHALPSRFDDILALAQQRIAAGRDRSLDSLWCFRHYNDDLAHQTAITLLLGRVLDEGLAPPTKVALVVEDKLYKTEPGLADESGLMALAAKLIASGADTRRSLSFFAYPWGEVGPDSLAARLRNMILEAEERDPSNVQHLLDLCLNRVHEEEEFASTLRRLVALIPEPDRLSAVLFALDTYEERPTTLWTIEWIRANAGLLGPPGAALVERLKNVTSRDLAEAVREIKYEMLT